MVAEKIRVSLVHQGIWDMEKLSMPLAHGYLKAMAMADDDVRREVDIRLLTFGGGDRLAHMIPEILLRDGRAPDILGFSVFGWNYASCGRIAETFKQLNPKGWCIYGGTHVSHQAKRVFRMHPEVDVIVNGEGERPFVKLLRAHLEGRSPRDLSGIHGISWRDESGVVHTSDPEPRFTSLDEIPSPFLTGALPLVDAHGGFLYDVAMMETNRGCPYKCAFCYWGGATGQKVYAFSRDRLRAELELFGAHRVENIALCDANFGAFAADETFVEDMLAVRAKYGYPRNLVNSWAKNKSKIFYRIVETMHRHQMSGDFTLALQTLSPAAVESANRKNMQLNQFEDLSRWLNERELPSYVELIWGLPGETYESFLEGYDRVAVYTSRIATYTNLLLPNTDYDTKREEYGLRTMRGDEYDYEYLLAHNTMSFEDNVKMHHFLFWARTLAEHLFFRFLWLPLRLFANIQQSEVLLGLDAWLEQRDDEVSRGLLACKYEVVKNLDGSRIGRGLRYLYQQIGIQPLLREWWSECVLPRVPAELVTFFEELLEYDLATQPVHGATENERGLSRRTICGEELIARDGVSFGWDFAALEKHLRTAANATANEVDVTTTLARFAIPRARHTLYFRPGFEQVIDNHETVLRYVAKTEREIEAEDDLRRRGLIASETQVHVVGLPDRSIERSTPLVQLGRRKSRPIDQLQPGA